MKLLVEDVLKLDILKHAIIIAGKNGLKNETSFVTVMDVPGIVKWLRGGEMLLSAGLFEECCNSEFFYSLKEKAVSAVITKPAYTDRMTPELVALCDELDIPVITVAQETSWGDITNPITELIARRQYDAIYQSQQFHSALMRSMIQGESLNQLCQEVYLATRLTIALTDADFTLTASSTNVDWARVMESFSIYSAHYHSALAVDVNGTTTAGYVYSNFYLGGIGKQAFIFPVIQDRITYSYIFLLAGLALDHLDVTDSMKVEQLALLVALAAVKNLELSNATRRYNNLLLDRILHGEFKSRQERLAIEQSLNRTFHESYYVVIMQDEEKTGSIFGQSLRISKLFDSLRANNVDFLDILCFERGSSLVFFLPGEEEYLPRTIEKLHKECMRMLGASRLFFGISNLTGNTEFPLAYKQAAQSLQYIRSYPKTYFCHYKDLGILRFFMDKSGNIDKEFLYDLRAQYILPIREYDAASHTQLEDTLSRFIQNNCSHIITERELFIHKNTLRARLAKIEKLLSCNLGNSEDLFHIQLALKIDYYFKNIA